MLGRVTITQGQLIFFGATYTVNTGSIGFFNPVRIEPILDLSLETTAKGVDVVLRVRPAPVDNMKLSYASDPPLQFQGNHSSTGGRDHSDLGPHSTCESQPSQPTQSFEQRWANRPWSDERSPIQLRVNSSGCLE